VTDPEVQVLETWFGKQLDALFQRTHSSQNEVADVFFDITAILM
jgi:hypothetical protein